MIYSRKRFESYLSSEASNDSSTDYTQVRLIQKFDADYAIGEGYACRFLLYTRTYLQNLYYINMINEVNSHDTKICKSVLLLRKL